MAVAILPITLMIGAATDLRRVETLRSAVQDASDAAVLNAAKAYLAAGGPENDPRRLEAARATAGGALRANLGAPDQLEQLAWTVEPVGGELVLTTTARVPLAFGGLFGMQSLPLKATAASVVSLRLEVAFVLDVTGSMLEGDKLGVLKTSTTNLIDQLQTAASTSPQPNPLKLALVPYSNTVRVDVGPDAKWLDGFSSGDGYWNPGLVPAPDPAVDRFTQYPAGWRGCLESRPYPHDVRDTAPSAADKDTLFVPYFRPGGDPNAGCDISPVVPLTFNFASVKTAVRGMTAGGYTNIPMGLVWGWHVLTPSGGPLGGVAEPYGRADLVKAVVLMTDGQNNLGNAEDEYSGVGLMNQNRVGVAGASNDAQRRAALDGRLAELCTNMKARGIVIYTVRVEVSEGSSEVLRKCATVKEDGETPLFYDVPDAAKLPAVFDKIGQDLIKLRLSR